MGKDADPSRSEVAAKNHCWCNDLSTSLAHVNPPSPRSLATARARGRYPRKCWKSPLIASVSVVAQGLRTMAVQTCGAAYSKPTIIGTSMNINIKSSRGSISVLVPVLI